MALGWTAAFSCALFQRSLDTGGQEQIKPVLTPTAKGGRRVIVFALDGTGADELLAAVHSGKAPRIAALLGKDRGGGLFAHAYAAPKAWSPLPSSTVSAWSAIFTGRPAGVNGIPGDEWFIRETQTFLAPVPISVRDTLDVTRVVNDDLLGKNLRVPTLYELVGGRSHVSLSYIHHGATLYTTVAPEAFVDMVGRLVAGTLLGTDPEGAVSAGLDLDSVAKLTEAIDAQGVPDLQVVYFPGIDIFTHVASERMAAQVGYLEAVTDRAVGMVLDTYARRGALEGTYVVFIADHAQIPTLNDSEHRLGTDLADSPFGVLAQRGFRVRRPVLTLEPGDADFQAVWAYQGFMAYLYLADRSTCPRPHDRCAWERPPRFREDVMEAVAALDAANRSGEGIPKMKGTLDLIFARAPSGPGEDARAFEVFDGKGLVPIRDYLKVHPRPDLIRLEERMRALSVGPYGNRAGDVLLLARACADVPLNARYYFAATPHYTWHGSACEADGHIPFILARAQGSGVALKEVMSQVAGETPSALALTPLVRALLSP